MTEIQTRDATLKTLPTNADHNLPTPGGRPCLVRNVRFYTFSRESTYIQAGPLAAVDALESQ